MGRDVFGEVNRMIVSVPVNPVTALLYQKVTKSHWTILKRGVIGLDLHIRKTVLATM